MVAALFFLFRLIIGYIGCYILIMRASCQVARNINSLLNPKKAQTEQYVIRDVRLFYNTVDRALETMRRSGFKADFSKDEDESSISLQIKIFK